MKANIYWIDGPWPGKLGIAPRPRGDDWLTDEIAAWRQAGIDAVISALEKEESDELSLSQEAALAGAHGMLFLACPIADRGVPTSTGAFVETLRQAGALLKRGKNVAVHCRQGIGRSALIAAGLLILEGLTPAEALSRVERARGLPVPETAEQRQWIMRLAAADHG